MLLVPITDIKVHLSPSSCQKKNQSAVTPPCAVMNTEYTASYTHFLNVFIIAQSRAQSSDALNPESWESKCEDFLKASLKSDTALK